MKSFSTSEVASILNLSSSRVRSFVRAGYIVPERNNRKTLQFNFRDLLFLKTAKGLLDAKVPVKKVIQVLSSLKKRIGKEDSLTRLRVYADGRRIVVRDGAVNYQPDTGQILFDFDPQMVLRAAELIARTKPKQSVSAKAAWEWFSRGCELEETSPDDAAKAYQKALDMDPMMSDAHVNLGRLFHKAGQLAQSEKHYRAAIAIDAGDPTPHFNLGIVLEDLKRPRDAVRSYEAALDRDPAFADAHYNLGLILDGLGKKKDAFNHLRTARNLYQGK
jgi:tetratricopeptide (TPR) repeat protein